MRQSNKMLGWRTRHSRCCDEQVWKYGGHPNISRANIPFCLPTSSASSNLTRPFVFLLDFNMPVLQNLSLTYFFLKKKKNTCTHELQNINHISEDTQDTPDSNSPMSFSSSPPLSLFFFPLPSPLPPSSPSFFLSHSWFEASQGIIIPKLEHELGSWKPKLVLATYQQCNL